MKQQKKTFDQLRVALVHDYLREYGGAERVVEALHEMFPQAPVYVGFVDQAALGLHWQKFADWDLRETSIAKLPLYKKLFSPYRIFAARAFEQLDLSEYDLVISSANAYMAKAVKVPNGTHLCYCHTPARSLYGYTTMTDWKKNPLVRLGGTLINHYLRVIDVQIAQRVDHFLANSHVTAARIKKFYRRDATVIYPPVTIPETLPHTSERSYYLFFSRLAFSKHPELAVQACTELNVPLKVGGVGTLEGRLKEIAGPTVEFLGAVDDQELAQLYAGARALIFPAEDEDFGIVPVEAMGHGVPVIAHRSGGPLETIVEGKTGVFFDALTVEGVKKALTDFEKKTFESKEIYEHAKKFGKKEFQKNIRKYIEDL